MNAVLLLGAGFPANWGGLVLSQMWETIFSDPAVQADEVLRNILIFGPWSKEVLRWQAQIRAAEKRPPGAPKTALVIPPKGVPPGDFDQYNYESVLAMLRYLQLDEQTKTLEDAIVRAFTSHQGFIQEGIYRGPIKREALRSLWEFLKSFEWVFSLNQDLSLEQMPLNGGFLIPGVPSMSPSPYFRSDEFTYSPRHDVQIPDADSRASQELALTDRPKYVKLHGAFNWRSASGDRLFITGGDKYKQIKNFALLSLYHERFLERACSSQLIFVIGYGFGDIHINGVLLKAATMGARLYVFDVRHPKQMRECQGFSEVWNYVSGYCTRPLLELFRAERRGITKFWDDLQRAYFR